MNEQRRPANLIGVDELARDILDDALHLPASDRAAIAAELIASIDGEADVDVDVTWATEIERRVRRVHSGESKGSPWPEVRARIEAKLRAR